jgi:purine nucleosidase
MKLILDIDPGVDDALGMIYLADAVRKGKLEISAIGTIGGNTNVTRTTQNALKLSEMLGWTAPVAKGTETPLLYALNSGEFIHGDDGLANTGLTPPTRQATGEHAVDQMLRMSLEKPGEYTVLAFGPLTNLGLAMLRDSSFAKRLQRVVLMGGGIDFGNVNAVAEANIYNDAEAARILFRSGVPITMVGLDVTHQTILLPKHLDVLAPYKNERAQLTRQLITHMMDAYAALGRPRECVLHDPLSAGVVVDPTYVTTKKYNVDVETRGEVTRGMTVVDRRSVPAEPANVDVAVAVDAERFVNDFMATLVAWAKD